MGTNDNKQIISGTIYYYDTEYRLETAKKVLAILKRHNMFPPEKIHADKLTSNKYVQANSNADALFTAAYSEKDVFEIDMASGDGCNSQEYWRVNWGLTYYKNSRTVGAGKVTPWNTLTLQSTCGKLRSPDAQENFLACFKELIALLVPFYASIDEVRNKIILQDKVSASCFIPHQVQQIYWGNYFGKELLDGFDIEIESDFPAFRWERLGDGIFFVLSDSLCSFDTKEVQVRRKKIRKQLNL